ncbi:metalloprotease [Mycena floridula]|nr:metalloprotease [Mycena floridula]
MVFSGFFASWFFLTLLWAIVVNSTKCGFDSLNPALAIAEKHFQNLLTREEFDVERRATATTLKVYFHVVSANSTLEGGNVPASQIKDQLAVLNETFQIMGLGWRLVNTSRTINQDWYENVGPNMPQQFAMKKALRQGGVKDLNVYSVGFVNGTGEGLLGYSTFPVSYGSAPNDDGVVIHSGSVPGGTKTPYNLGMTLVHELGHWCGLYHTFENSCSSTNDYVSDTAQEASAAYGCMRGRDTCKGGGVDPIWNYMDYSDDSCMTGFTKGQATRARAQLKTYRGIPA